MMNTRDLKLPPWHGQSFDAESFVRGIVAKIRRLQHNAGEQLFVDILPTDLGLETIVFTGKELLCTDAQLRLIVIEKLKEAKISPYYLEYVNEK